MQKPGVPEPFNAVFKRHPFQAQMLADFCHRPPKPKPAVNLTARVLEMHLKAQQVIQQRGGVPSNEQRDPPVASSEILTAECFKGDGFSALHVILG